MSVHLGKRKRRVDLKDKEEGIDDQTADSKRLQQLLQKHFEAKYTPLDVVPTLAPPEDNVSSDSIETSDDDWEGISDYDHFETVEIVSHETKDETDRWREKQERRSFMTNKPPASNPEKDTRKKRPTDSSIPDDAAEAKNLKNDLALQRLLQESSLLKNARSDANGTMPSALHPSDDPATASIALRGLDRHKALDLRLQSLGAKSSLFKQKKMPLNHRLGIIEKQRTREKERRHEARENGIVLEKEGKGRHRTGAKRDRGVGGPSVGKMRGGTLVLSQRDVRSIQGPTSRERGAHTGRRKR